MARAIGDAIDELTFAKAWELRSELSDDHRQARHEVTSRFVTELLAEEERVRRRYEPEMKLDPPRRFYIEFDPEVDSKEDVLRRFRAVRPKGARGSRGGRPRIDKLVALRCAVLHEEHNTLDPTYKRRKRWTYKSLQKELEEYGVRSERSAEEHVQRGKHLLATRKKNLQES